MTILDISKAMNIDKKKQTPIFCWIDSLNMYSTCDDIPLAPNNFQDICLGLVWARLWRKFFSKKLRERRTLRSKRFFFSVLQSNFIYKYTGRFFFSMHILERIFDTLFLQTSSIIKRPNFKSRSITSDKFQEVFVYLMLPRSTVLIILCDIITRGSWRWQRLDTLINHPTLY